MGGKRGEGKEKVHAKMEEERRKAKRREKNVKEEEK
jgi:hypothetical protein